MDTTRKGRFMRDLVREYPQYVALLKRLVEVLPDCRLLVFGTYGYGYLTYEDLDVLIWPGPNCMLSEAASDVVDKCLSGYEIQENCLGYDNSKFMSIKVLPAEVLLAGKICNDKKLNLIIATKIMAIATQQSTIMLAKMPELPDKDQRRGVFEALSELFKSKALTCRLKLDKENLTL